MSKLLQGMTFIGIDPAATRLAGVVLTDSDWSLVRRTMPTDPVLRLVKAESWMYRVVRETQARGRVFVGIETPLRMMDRGTIPNAMVHAALILGAVRAGAEVIQINNARWKKVVVGNGHAKKPQIMRHVKKTWPRLYREANGSQDLMDAACIVQHTKYVVGIRERVAATQARRNSAVA